MVKTVLRFEWDDFHLDFVCREVVGGVILSRSMLERFFHLPYEAERIEMEFSDENDLGPDSVELGLKFATKFLSRTVEHVTVDGETPWTFLSFAVWLRRFGARRDRSVWAKLYYWG